jgi:hypothetical protein
MVVQQMERDKNIKALLLLMRDIFEMTSEAEDVEERCKMDTKQAQIVSHMLQQVTHCADFISSYAKPENVSFCMYCQWARMLRQNSDRP